MLVGELDYDGARLCCAPFKSICLLQYLGSLGCGSEANAIKDSVDALMCVSYLESCALKPTGCFNEMGPRAWSPEGTHHKCVYLWISD